MRLLREKRLKIDRESVELFFDVTPRYIVSARTIVKLDGMPDIVVDIPIPSDGLPWGGGIPCGDPANRPVIEVECDFNNNSPSAI